MIVFLAKPSRYPWCFSATFLNSPTPSLIWPSMFYIKETKTTGSVEMEEAGGKQEGEANEMFSWDSCSFSLWAATEVAATEEERGKKRVENNGGGGKGESNVEEEEEPAPEFHTQTERERRQRMRNMFTTLHGLIPHLRAKADKTTIVEETVNYISVLEQQVRILQAAKDEKLKRLSNSNNVITFNPFPPSSSSSIPPPREAIFADHGYYSSSASVTPANSCPTTPKSSLIIDTNRQNPNPR